MNKTKMITRLGEQLKAHFLFIHNSRKENYIKIRSDFLMKCNLGICVKRERKSGLNRG